MKKFLVSAALATVLTAVASTAQVAMSQDLRALADAKPMRLKCAIHVGDAQSIRPKASAPSAADNRPCESYWADDTDADERELGKPSDVGHATAAVASTLAKR